jgi:hypothetical protein
MEKEQERKTEKINEKNRGIQSEVVGLDGFDTIRDHLDNPIFGTQKELDTYIDRFRELRATP